ncbi:MAG: single-stranded DNA-binding protein [Bacteroidales bacterium]|nr:single-stranded DNA-binding protein [Bacteroidales bacterium]
MNKVMLIGNVGQEPDVHYYGADQARAEVRLATTERGYKLPNGTEVPARTDWHTLLFFGNLAKTVEHYVHKGDKLYVEGRLRYSVYNDKLGQRRNVTEILVASMEMLSPRPQQPAANPAARPSQPEANETKPNQLPF